MENWVSFGREDSSRNQPGRWTSRHQQSETSFSQTKTGRHRKGKPRVLQTDWTTPVRGGSRPFASKGQKLATGRRSTPVRPLWAHSGCHRHGRSLSRALARVFSCTCPCGFTSQAPHFSPRIREGCSVLLGNSYSGMFPWFPCHGEERGTYTLK